MAFRSLLGFWLGGAGSKQAPTAGFGGLLAFWMGGGGLRLESPVSPITATPVVRFRDPDEELLSIMAAIMPHVVQIIKD